MKLSHLSLSILSALALAACGGGGGSNNQTTTDNNNGGNDKPKPAEPTNPVEVESTVVDPTQNDVVVQFSLDSKPSVGQLSYIRQKDSRFNINDKNKDVNSAATAFVSIPLESQNPHLTNIVLGQLIGTSDKTAQFAGSLGQDFNPAQDKNTLQALNGVYHKTSLSAVANRDEVNASIQDLIKDRSGGADKKFDIAADDADGVAITDAKNGIGLYNGVYYYPKVNLVAGKVSQETVDNNKAITDYLQKLNKVTSTKAALDKAVAATPTDSTSNGFGDQLTAYNDAVTDLKTHLTAANITAIRKAAAELGLKLNANVVTKSAAANQANGKTNGIKAGSESVSTIMLAEKSWLDYAASYGVGVVDWKVARDNDGKSVDNHTDSGLVTVNYDPNSVDERKLIRGSEDNNTGDNSNNTQATRIFGHYYLDPKEDVGDLWVENKKENVQVVNSYRGAQIYTAADGSKQFGAIAQPLDYVQYGRVTAQVDPEDGTDVGTHSNWVMKRVNTANKGDATSVDYYFARGTYATSLDQMAALPVDKSIHYEGHALLWGVDNSYNYGKDLPNAFGNGQKLGLGNFVEADLNMGDKTFKGNVYNAWVDTNAARTSLTSKSIEKQHLVDFSGDVIGNSVVGEAIRTADGDKGDLRASFYGSNADEVGGSFNSTTAKDIYGNAKWGGVFGAKRVLEATATSTANKWLGDAN